jgi:hypothetical protein
MEESYSNVEPIFLLNTHLFVSLYVSIFIALLLSQKIGNRKQHGSLSLWLKLSYRQNDILVHIGTAAVLPTAGM